MKTRFGFVIFLLGSALLQSGCIILPIPTPEEKVMQGRPVAPEQIAFLSRGVTTSAQVVARLGKPDIVWEEARVYAYNWVLRSGVLFWAVGAGGSGAAGLKDIEDRHALLIQFDRQDRVKRFESVERPAFKSYGDFLKEWVKKPDE